MTERQTKALQSPCARADQTLRHRFWERLCVDGRWLSTIITVNK
jgi:hypothetical protein